MLSKNKLGGADVKLSAACAFLLGFEKGVIGLAIGLFISIITNLIIEKIKKSKDQPFPLVPYLSIGFMLMYYC
jgi:prepilin signal peptidase PulO-like enzyme (type II secretory pathway)